MSRPIELVYSTQRNGFVEGRAYANPRFYSTPRSNISKVYLVGQSCPNGQKIRADYEAQGVKVEVVDAAGVTMAAAPKRQAAAAAPAHFTGLPEDTRGSVFIPEAWEDLPWTPKPDEDLSLRALAAMVSDTPIINKAQAKAAIIAELERRKATADVPGSDETRPDGADAGDQASGATTDSETLPPVADAEGPTEAEGAPAEGDAAGNAEGETGDQA
jgi:hypothetical protein